MTRAEIAIHISFHGAYSCTGPRLPLLNASLAIKWVSRGSETSKDAQDDSSNKFCTWRRYVKWVDELQP